MKVRKLTISCSRPTRAAHRELATPPPEGREMPLWGRKRAALLPYSWDREGRIQSQTAEAVELALSYLLIHCISTVVGSLEQALLSLLSVIMCHI